MKIRENVGAILEAVDKKFASQFQFHIKDASFTKLVNYMHLPKDSSSLAVTRILFGLSMLFDIPDERGGANLEDRWGNSICHFPLLPFLQAIPMPYMAIVYAGLWCGAVGIMVGYKYRFNAIMFTVCYWYLFLIEKSFWNNHSYLFGLVALLLTCTEANCCWSIDVYQNPLMLKTTVPYWNYFILKYQFFILYFMAGLKKGSSEWLTGYSVQSLAEHWVFGPFKLFLTVPQIDYLVVHWFIFAFDLTVAMWMMYSKTRHVAMTFCALFHLMNSRLFRIGMFPWVCLATMPLFYPFDWPRVVLRKFAIFHQNKNNYCKLTTEVNDDASCVNNVQSGKGTKICEPKALRHKQKERCMEEDYVFTHKGNFDKTKTDNENNAKDENGPNYERNKITLYFILFHVATQAFLPFSHFVTKGYNNWTDGLYGYSWDMMVHTWDTHAVVLKLVDNKIQSQFYIDPTIHAPNDRWTRHSDMVVQYARCLRDKLTNKPAEQSSKLSQNISIYLDVWCSMNGRFTQRQFDPKVDLLNVEWSPFKSSSYLMPLLDEGLSWRAELNAIKNHVYSWSNDSDVVFLADFPGYEQEKYISSELRNVTLTILEGEVAYEQLVTKLQDGFSYKLSAGDTMRANTGTFHKVINIGEKPAYYMYTFYKFSETVPTDSGNKPKLPIFTELYNRLTKITIFLQQLLTNLVKVFYIIAHVLI